MEMTTGEIRLFNRLRRRLRQESGETLHRCRETSLHYHDLGRYYVTDERNCLVEKDVCLVDLQSRLDGRAR